MPRPRAHPRSHGEHGAREGAEGALPGSSPLARGTYELRPEVGVCRRLIPARAGNIFTTRPIDCLPSAHPRSRGEHTDLNHIQTDNAGSSPLARGALTLRLTLLRSTRLIPARAGNISRFSPILTSTAAHPRSRGEHREYPPGFFAGFGSSPLARGTLGARRKPYRSDSAHPRSRGEHCFKVNAKSESSGSSPLARGTSRVLLPPIHPVRLIPARTGNTALTGTRSPTSTAHPRSHGEHVC